MTSTEFIGLHVRYLPLSYLVKSEIMFLNTLPHRCVFQHNQNAFLLLKKEKKPSETVRRKNIKNVRFGSVLKALCVFKVSFNTWTLKITVGAEL